MGKFTEFQLPLKSLPKGEHKFTYHLGKQFFADMESADIRDADVDVTLTVVYRNDVYDLSFACAGTVTVLCDRCLDEMEIPIQSDYHIVVKYGDAYRDDSDELLEIPERESSLNVAYMIYDTVALSVPMKHVHPMGKCNRQMRAALSRHRARPLDEDAALEDELIDEMDSMDSTVPTDPRWNALRDIDTGDSDND